MTQAFVEYFSVSGACWNRKKTTLGLALSIQINQSISSTNGPIHHDSRHTGNIKLLSKENLTVGTAVFPSKGMKKMTKDVTAHASLEGTYISVVEVFFACNYDLHFMRVCMHCVSMTTFE